MQASVKRYAPRDAHLGGQLARLGCAVGGLVVTRQGNLPWKKELAKKIAHITEAWSPLSIDVRRLNGMCAE